MGGNASRAQWILDRAIRTRYHYTPHTNQVTVKTEQRVEKILDAAARARAHDRDTRGEFGKRGDFRRTMTVPMNLLQEIVVHRLGLPARMMFDPDVAKKVWNILHTSEYKYLRTTNDRRIG